MRIDRIQVEEGFLDGLDLRFAPGLNVIIGARGVGKTSIVELIRYCLRIPHLDERRAVSARQHAEAVLRGGRVTVVALVDGQLHTFSRAASDPDVTDSGLLARSAPEMLGQNELEAIGLDGASRLKLIDTRAGILHSRSLQSSEDARQEVISLTRQLREVLRQVDGLRQQELLLPSVLDQLAEARARESELLSAASEHLSALRVRLSSGTAAMGALASEREGLNQLSARLAEVQRLSNATLAVLSDASLDHVQEDGGSSLWEELHSILGAHNDLLARVRSLGASVVAESNRLAEAIAEADDELRPVRVEFDRYQTGAGEAAQLTARLERQVQMIQEQVSRVATIEERASAIRALRTQLLDAIDAEGEALYTLRRIVIDELNSQFAPRIQISIDHLGDTTEYAHQLASALRGSGLQYNQIADWLVERVTPHELVIAAERGDGVTLATVGELTPNRVEKLVAHLGSSDHLGQILTARVEDVVEFNLLVGSSYRSSDELSTGQRCALVLPLLLAEGGRTLVLDQPEDHLDNEYLVENTVLGLRARSRTAQTIVVTHNANIPVLGDADRVIALQSDGRRGYLAVVGGLEDPRVVDAITNLMEGGRVAFERRAAFYRLEGN